MIVCGLFLASAQAFAWGDYNYQDYQVNTYSNSDYSQTNPDYRVCAVAITRDLRMGSQNSEVTVLQDYLHDASYLDVSPNGYFGSATRQAVILFQRDKGISTTGTVGYVTRNEINNAICNVNETFGYDGSSYGLPVVSPTTQIPTTYVSSQDPFVQRQVSIQAPIFSSVPTNTSLSSNSYISSVPTLNKSAPFPATINPITPVTSQIYTTTIVNNPGTGYTIGIIPKSSSVNISSPLVNSVYKEGDTVNLSWTASNLNNAVFQVLLENTSTSQSRVVSNATPVSSLNGNTFSFVLTKELLDSVCATKCDDNQQRSFRIVVSTPVTDIAGNTTNFRATVSPFTIKRATEFLGGISLTTTKNPVNSGEAFRLYTSIPTGMLLDSNNKGLYSFRIHAICPVSISVSIAGTPCGTDIPVPYDAPFFQQEIPVMVTSSSWYKQEVTFELVIVNLLGQVVNTSKAKVIVNPAPFNW